MSGVLTSIISFLCLCILCIGAPLSSLATGPHTPTFSKELPLQSSTVVFETLDGKLLKIEGKFYVVEDLMGKRHRLRLSNHATLLNGPKKPGDTVRLEIAEARAITVQ